MALHNEIGKIGEEIALKFLKNLGYEVLELNWRFRKLEIDIIAKDGDTLVVIEVKTRKSDTFGAPDVFVDKKKQRFLIKAINEYVNQKNLENEIRFDIVSVLYDNNQEKIEHIKDAFYPIVS
ncbi:MAG: YraN family protein [Bacteroidetes bacterium]|nr:YraN family protein [Bacteroidota bacterium]